MAYIVVISGFNPKLGFYIIVSIEKNCSFLSLAPFGAKQGVSFKIMAKQAQLMAISRKKA
jgi:hypothetical protein